jgi:chemotaxis protein MotA
MALLLGCLAVVYLFEGSSVSSGAYRLLHWPAMVLTGVGPLALVILCSDWQMLFRTLGLAIGTSAWSRQRKHEREAVFLQQLGNRFYSEGPKVFEDVQAKRLSQHVAKVLDRLNVKMPIPDIRSLLQTERDRKHNRFCQCLNVVSMGVRLAPSVGMLGTILGMMQLLSTLQDTSQIGSRMSLALLTTFYGLFFSLAVWTPFQQKLERISEVELDGYDQVIRWLEFLEKRKPSDYFADTVEIPAARKTSARKAGSRG